MNADPASLANLRDIVTPPPVPWWPPAAGWWFLLAALGLVAITLAVHAIRGWRANAYRRAALRALDGAESAVAIAEILKRAALMACPRAEVASLTGSAWLKWLAETGGQPVPTVVSQALSVGVFAGRDFDQNGELTAFANEWIRNHRVGRRAGEGR